MSLRDFTRKSREIVAIHKIAQDKNTINKDRIMRIYRSQNQAKLNQNSPKRPLHNGAPAIHSGKPLGLDWQL